MGPVEYQWSCVPVNFQVMAVDPFSSLYVAAFSQKPLAADGYDVPAAAPPSPRLASSFGGHCLTVYVLVAQDSEQADVGECGYVVRYHVCHHGPHALKSREVGMGMTWSLRSS